VQVLNGAMNKMPYDEWKALAAAVKGL
jgi:hypothetical protein